MVRDLTVAHLCVDQVRTLKANSPQLKYLAKMHMVAGVMPFDTVKKNDVFYTLTGKSAGTDTSEGVSTATLQLLFVCQTVSVVVSLLCSPPGPAD